MLWYSEEEALILFIFGTVINHKYTLALCQNVAIMPIISSFLYVCSDISEMNGWILFMLGTMMNNYRGLMNILRCCAKISNLCLFCHNLCVFLWYLTHDSWMLFIFSIMIIYHKSLMHVRPKFTPCRYQVNWAICAVLNSLC